MIAPKITSTGISRISARRRSSFDIGSPTGARSGRSRTSSAITAMNPTTAIRPGRIAAWNISMIEASTMIA